MLPKELELYNKLLLKKTECIFLSKSDEVTKGDILKIKNNFKKIDKEIIPISIADEKSIEVVKKILNHLQLQKNF